MMRLKSSQHKVSGITLAILVAAVSPQIANANSVVDRSGNQKLSEIRTAVQHTTNEEQKQTQAMDRMNQTMGSAGASGNLITMPYFKDLGSQSTFYKNMERFGFDMCAVSLCQVGSNPTDTDDIDIARSWAEQTFFSSVPLTNAKRQDLEEVRRRAISYATSNAYALSTTVHNSLATSAVDATALEELIKSAPDHRGDVQAISAVGIANYKVAVQQLAVLSAILDVQAARALQETSVYHENGGTEFPDAYIEADYLSNGNRTQVTIPERGTAD